LCYKTTACGENLGAEDMTVEDRRFVDRAPAKPAGRDEIVVTSNLDAAIAFIQDLGADQISTAFQSRLWQPQLLAAIRKMRNLAASRTGIR
jgi:hypothetical protein